MLTPMKKFLLTIGCLALTACGNTEGISATSTKEPKGNPNASVIVSEYADLQCPACRGAHMGATAAILEQYGNDIRFEFKHFPLRAIHRYALDAAVASECAADQGKFWEYIDVAFAKQEDLSLSVLDLWAKEVGVEDMDLFARCRKSGAKKDLVLREFEEGREMGVTGTPTYFVNGQRTESNTLQNIVTAIETAKTQNAQPL